MMQGQLKDETAVLLAAGSLDHDALSAIFDEYAPAIFKYLLRLEVNSQEADQIVGDVFARLLDKFVKGEGPRTNLRSYLFQTAYHLVVDHARESSVLRHRCRRYIKKTSNQFTR
jgi:RNA polymerase sigma factor (sigma-70 family)